MKEFVHSSWFIVHCSQWARKLLQSGAIYFHPYYTASAVVLSHIVWITDFLRL